MINLTTLFTSLGVVNGNTQATNFYEFWYGIEFNGGTITYNITEFMTYLGTTRYEFFQSLNSTYPDVFDEYTFYKNIDDPRIYDFYTFYTYGAQEAFSPSVTPTPTPTSTSTPTPTPTPSTTATPTPTPTSTNTPTPTPTSSPAGSYLLDNAYASDVVGAFSLRRLSSSYSGSVITVRRSSDNTETNIGFSGSGLDETALTTFCSGANCFVKTWFNQDGSGKNATQTTTSRQPKIYDSVTGILTQNGKPALSFNGTSQTFIVSNFTSNALYTQLVLSNSTASFNEHGFGGDGFYTYSLGGSFVNARRTTRLEDGGASGFTGTGYKLITYQINGLTATTASGVYSVGGSCRIFENDVEKPMTYRAAAGERAIANNNSVTATLTIGSRSGTGAPFNNGLFQEILHFTTNKNNSDIRSIQIELNNYYSIFTPITPTPTPTTTPTPTPTTTPTPTPTPTPTTPVLKSVTPLSFRQDDTGNKTQFQFLGSTGETTSGLNTLMIASPNNLNITSITYSGYSCTKAIDIYTSEAGFLAIYYVNLPVSVISPTIVINLGSASRAISIDMRRINNATYSYPVSTYSISGTTALATSTPNTISTDRVLFITGAYGCNGYTFNNGTGIYEPTCFTSTSFISESGYNNSNPTSTFDNTVFRPLGNTIVNYLSAVFR